jgi:hypothetical protein
MYNIIAYIIYLSLSLFTVLWVGKILRRNGKDYLFAECPDRSLSEASNNFLYIGFCLLNSGFAFYFLNTCETLLNFVDVIEFITCTTGFIYVTLGFIHFINMLLAPRIINLFISKRNINQSPTKNGTQNQTS